MSGQHIGYIRVSTLDQHTEQQLEGVEVDNARYSRHGCLDVRRCCRGLQPLTSNISQLEVAFNTDLRDQQNPL